MPCWLSHAGYKSPHRCMHANTRQHALLQSPISLPSLFLAVRVCVCAPAALEEHAGGLLLVALQVGRGPRGPGEGHTQGHAGRGRAEGRGHQGGAPRMLNRFILGLLRAWRRSRARPRRPMPRRRTPISRRCAARASRLCVQQPVHLCLAMTSRPAVVHALPHLRAAR